MHRLAGILNGCVTKDGCLAGFRINLDIRDMDSERVRETLRFTGTPFISTVHAPQLPLLQPSFAPVNRSWSRRISRRLCRDSQTRFPGR